MQTPQHYLRTLTKRAYSGDDTFVSRWRKERMQRMLDCVQPPAGARIIDLGGTEFNWRLFDHDFHVTLVNLPGKTVPTSDPKRFVPVEADACHLGEVFKEPFDIAFSNSVIEHVGPLANQRLFANEVRRLGRGYWVQTPSRRFPIEPHSATPFYWQMPEAARARLIRGWRKRLPGWTDMIENTRVLSLDTMRELFPEGKVEIERQLGFEKSFSLYRPYNA